MAYRRNPMPTHGALFVTNPRRRSNGRMNLMVAREMGYGGGHGGSQRAGKLKSTVGKTKKKAKADLKAYGAAYESAGGNTRRAELKATAPARRTRFKTGVRAWKRKFKVSQRGTPKARKAFKSMVIDAPVSTRKSKSKSTPRRANQELSDMYRRKSNPRRRRNGLALKVNRKGRRRNSANAKKAMKLYHSPGGPRTLKAAWKIVNGTKSNPRRRKNASVKSSHRSLAMKRNGTKKGMRRKTARPAYAKKRRNPVRRRNTGFGGLAMKLNPATSTGIMPIDALSKVIGMVPVIGKPIAPFAAPLIIGYGSAVALYFIAEKTETMLPDMLQPYALPLLGVAGAVVTLAQPLGSKKTKGLIAAGMVTGAGAIYAYQMMSERSVAMASGSMEGDGMMMEGDAGLSGLALMQNPGYGAWDYTGGALNNPGYGAYEYTGSGALNNPAGGEYSDAHYGDAQYSGNDFDAQEGNALVKGRGMWYKIFGRPGRRMYNRSGNTQASSHAGKRGHRWGWLIKLVGFEGARKLAAMPPAARLDAIKKFKHFARQKLAELTNPSLALNEAPDAPSVYEEMGPSGAHGYGALMYTGSTL